MDTIPGLELNAEDIRFVFDEIPFGALLIDAQNRSIVSANRKFLEMNQLAWHDIAGSQVSAVIREIPTTNIVDGSSHNGMIEWEGKQPIPIRYSIHYFGKKGRFLFIRILPLSQKYDSEPLAFYEKLFDQQKNLLEAIHTKNQADLLADIEESARQLLGADYSVMYLKSDRGDALIRTTQEDPIFPANIPELELSRIRQVDVWSPGKRVLSEIHRVCRLNQINSLYVIPVVKNKERIGLMAIAFKDLWVFPALSEMVLKFSEWASQLLALFFQLQQFHTSIQSLNEVAERNQAILGLLDEGFVVLNDDFQIVDFNEAFRKMVDYYAVELFNKGLQLFLNSTAVEKIHQAIKNHKRIVLQDIYQIHNRTGTGIFVLIGISKYECGEQHYSAVLLKNTDEVVSMRRKVADVENKISLGEVVADFAHEVRNPINNLTTGLQLLAKRANIEPTNLDIITRMQEDCVRMNYLMESVLAYSRQKDVNFKDISLNALINRLIFRFKTKLSEKGIDFHFRNEFPDQEVMLKADQRALEQVIINIFNNAMDAIADQKGSISLIITGEDRHPGYVCLKIADTGFGIPTEIKDKIFEPFVSEKPGGTGLGLAIAGKIMDAHRGWIDLETYPGGTIFNIFLPLLSAGEKRELHSIDH